MGSNYLNLGGQKGDTLPKLLGPGWFRYRICIYKQKLALWNCFLLLRIAKAARVGSRVVGMLEL